MKIYKNIKQNSPAWLELRKGKITGSEVYKLFMGDKTKGKIDYIISKTTEIITGEYSDQYFSNIHTKRGHALENDAKLYYEILSNTIVEDVAFISLNKYIGCSPDGLVAGDGIIEIKCKDNPNFFKQLKNGEAAIEKEYINQMQFNLYVSKREWCDYICYNPNFEENPVYITRIYKDLVIHNQLEIKIEEAIKEIKANIKFYDSIKTNEAISIKTKLSEEQDRIEENLDYFKKIETN